MSATALTAATPARSAPGAARPAARLDIAPGIDLVGEYEGSGYREPHYIARRSDGQVIQLSELLFLVARAAEGGHTPEEIAPRVSEEFGRAVSAGNVMQLVDRRLTPLGVLVPEGAEAPTLHRRDPMLALKMRRGVIPTWMVRALTLAFRPLFMGPVVVAVLLGLVGLDVWLFGVHGMAQPIRSLLAQPLNMLLLLGLVIASAAFHECGHATGCAYGGARPGVMGMGLYLVWPAFYTDVTDAYRLGRGGRLRTDLGGLYFNVIFLLVVAGVYSVTHLEALLAIVVLQHIEMLHQLLPFLRLDGYYIVADLVGVPDLFARIKPVMTSVLPWKPTDASVRELKPWVRVAVTLWVSLTVVFLLYAYAMLLIHLPQMLASAWVSLQQLWHGATQSVGAGAWGMVVLDILQAILLLLPIAGIGFLVWKTVAKVVELLMRTRGHPVVQGSLGLCTAAAAVLIVVALGPRAHYRPISPTDTGTIQGGVAGLVSTYAPNPASSATTGGATTSGSSPHQPAAAPVPGSASTGATPATAASSAPPANAPASASAATSQSPSTPSPAPSSAASASAGPTPTP